MHHHTLTSDPPPLPPANPDYAAILLAGPGGKVCVIDLKRPGRQPDGVVPSLLNGAKVMDFGWDPFDNSHIAVGT